MLFSLYLISIQIKKKDKWEKIKLKGKKTEIKEE